MMIKRKLCVIVLAAGKGTRMKSGKTNKVTLLLADKPLILHAINLLEKMKFEQIIVVVGFAKDSVKKVLKEKEIYFVEQKKRMGTAHAVIKAIPHINEHITDVLIIQGDDSHFYDRETLSKLVKFHIEGNSGLTFLTINAQNPFGLGRIVRSKDGHVKSIVEEKDADLNTRKIKEVNPACYILRAEFLKKYIKKVPRSEITKEYYLTSIVDIALKNNEKIETVNAGNIPWRGVNTRDELIEAEKIYKNIVG